MSASDSRTYRLVSQTDRFYAREAIKAAPDGWVAVVRPPRRSLDQNAKFHALCEDVARSGYEWAGCARTAEEWKVLLITGHAVATGRSVEIVPNIEDERQAVQLRESSARMSKERGSSLIEYTISWAISHGIKLRDMPA